MKFSTAYIVAFMTAIASVNALPVSMYKELDDSSSNSLKMSIREKPLHPHVTRDIENLSNGAAFNTGEADEFSASVNANLISENEVTADDPYSDTASDKRRKPRSITRLGSFDKFPAEAVEDTKRLTSALYRLRKPYGNYDPAADGLRLRAVN